MRPFGSAPTLVAAGWPFLNRIIVGMPRTPYLVGAAGFSSMLSLTMVDAVAELVAELLERRRDHPARTAPFGPEIDEDRPLGAQHVLLEGGSVTVVVAMRIS